MNHDLLELLQIAKRISEERPFKIIEEFDVSDMIGTNTKAKIQLILGEEFFIIPKSKVKDLLRK